jgi:hypothetical protein
MFSRPRSETFSAQGAVSTATDRGCGPKWRLASEQLAAGRWGLLGLWGETERVHMALSDVTSRQVGVISLECRGGRYPSVGESHAPAMRLERAAADLFGLLPQGAPDSRLWLDHGQWGFSQPLGAQRPASPGAAAYRFLTDGGEGLR